MSLLGRAGTPPVPVRPDSFTPLGVCLPPSLVTCSRVCSPKKAPCVCNPPPSHCLPQPSLSLLSAPFPCSTPSIPVKSDQYISLPGHRNPTERLFLRILLASSWLIIYLPPRSMCLSSGAPPRLGAHCLPRCQSQKQPPPCTPPSHRPPTGQQQVSSPNFPLPLPPGSPFESSPFCPGPPIISSTSSAPASCSALPAPGQSFGTGNPRQSPPTKVSHACRPAGSHV